MKIGPRVRTAIYVVIGVGWIWLSDQALAHWARSPAALTWLQDINGWAFVLFSGLVIYWLMWLDARRLGGANQALSASYQQAVRALVVAMDARHHETHDHSQRVARMTIRMARLAGITAPEELHRIEFGALLHDIGKIRLADATLLKAGPLDADEMAHVRRHPDFGNTLLDQIDFLRPCAEIAYCHHECWNGSGYPRGLSGQQIPYAARLFSVVDVWDALIHGRVYKDAWTDTDVRAYIEAHAGTQFDPDVTRLFLDHYSEVVAGEESSTDHAPMAWNLPGIGPSGVYSPR